MKAARAFLKDAPEKLSEEDGIDRMLPFIQQLPKVKSYVTAQAQKLNALAQHKTSWVRGFFIGVLWRTDRLTLCTAISCRWP